LDGKGKVQELKFEIKKEKFCQNEAINPHLKEILKLHLMIIGYNDE
jgi:hypothetical protein